MIEKCVKHPDKDAVGFCSTCGRPFCRSCVIETPDGNLYCRSDAALGMCYRKQGAGRLATLAFILALVGISNLFTAIAGIIIGRKELTKIKRGESPEAGKRLARWAVIIGSIGAAFWTLYIIFYITLIAAGILGSNHR